MSQTYLDKILTYKRLEIDHIKRKVSKKDLEKKAADVESAFDFLKNFSEKSINVIAEVKKASPSAGLIREDFDAVTISQIYEDNGAKALSVLTDENFFKGHLKFLPAIKAKVKLPVLRKDFIIDDYQVFEARAHEADAVLLIVVALDDYQLKDYLQVATELGMTSLIEVHDQKELEKALKVNSSLIGINNRNLKTFETDIQVTRELINCKTHLQQSVHFISESGLKTHDQLVELKEKGVDGFLIGETLMREDDYGMKLRELIG